MQINMDPRLTEAARSGNIGDLYTLIQEDPYILKSIDEVPFFGTPLHIAAIAGQINFAMEMMILKPSFARKLNQDGYSPMHLELRNGHPKLVLRLLKTDKDLVRVKGREGMTPLHYVVTLGDSNLLYEFLEACPECIEDVTVQGETALHLALKNEQMEAFNIIIGWLQRNRRRSASDLERKIVNCRDHDDNTVLHIAARKEQHQALKLLLDFSLRLDVKAKNSEGLTALQILQNDDASQEMNSGENDAKIEHLKKKITTYERLLIRLFRAKNSLTVDLLNALLVITALVMTATYQSSLSPPGGLRQEDNSSFNTTSNVTRPHFLAHNSTYNRSEFLVGEESRKAGTTIMDPHSYFIFWLFNFGTFCVAILQTVFLLSSVPQFLSITFLLYPFAVSYIYSMTIISPSTVWSVLNFLFMGSVPWVTILLFSFSKEERKGERKDRTRILQVLRTHNSVGFIQRWQRTIEHRFCIN